MVRRRAPAWGVKKADELVPGPACLCVFRADGIQLSPSRRHNNAIFGNATAYQSLLDPVRAPLANSIRQLEVRIAQLRRKKLAGMNEKKGETEIN